MTIIISKNGKNAQKIEETSFKDEDYLQKYIYDNPEVLPLYKIKEDIRILIVAREFNTGSGPIDALGIDKDGEIYIIETKLYKNSDKRLVVAQILDYGASLWYFYNNYDDFLREIDKHVNNQFRISFNQKLKDFFDVSDTDIEIIFKNIKSNLFGGNFRFVVLMNKIEDKLKDLIVFLNQRSNFDIFGIEFEYYKYENYEIIIPKLFGAEVKKEISSGDTRRRWDEKTFFEDVNNKLSEDRIKTIRSFYEFSRSLADEVTWGTGAATGSFSIRKYKISNNNLYGLYSSGTFFINFEQMKDSENAKTFRDNLKKELEIIGIDIPENYQERFFNIKVDNWISKSEEIINIIGKLMK